MCQATRVLPALLLLGFTSAAEATCIGETCGLDTSFLQTRAQLEGATKDAEALFPKFVLAAYAEVADTAHEKLVEGSKAGAAPRDPEDLAARFSAVDVSLPLGTPIIRHTGGLGQVDKNLVAEQQLLKLGHQCVVYGIGIAPASSHEESIFEQSIAAMGCETHAFDCSVKEDDPNVAGKGFHFHRWCIGTASNETTQEMEAGWYSGDYKPVYKTLEATMKELGHQYIDLLKFDIEGFEWQLFENELLAGGLSSMPLQLAFELHTEGANRMFVPEDAVAGKGYVEVNKLFLKLHDLGYRVASKELNMDGKELEYDAPREPTWFNGAEFTHHYNSTAWEGDRYCAEFVLVNVNM